MDGSFLRLKRYTLKRADAYVVPTRVVLTLLSTSQPCASATFCSLRAAASRRLIIVSRPTEGLTGSNPLLTKRRRLAAREFAEQVTNSRWLRIQSVNRVFALMRSGFRRLVPLSSAPAARSEGVAV
jgi:hypothetical protein